MCVDDMHVHELRGWISKSLLTSESIYAKYLWDEGCAKYFCDKTLCGSVLSIL